MWGCIDQLPEERDYLQVFELEKVGTMQSITHRAEKPEHRKVYLLPSDKENIDTNTPQGRFVLSIFAALSELEREQTLQRQREGIAIAKSQGKYKGRQPLPIDWIKFGQLYEQWKSGTITAVWFQKEMGLRANTFYRRLKEYERKIT